MRYEIQGEPMPVVVCHLNNGESMITEKGSMVWMTAEMEMQTSAGGLGKAFGRMFSGESMFQNIYTCQGGTGHDRLCLQLSRLHPGGGDHPGPAGDRARSPPSWPRSPGCSCPYSSRRRWASGFFGGEGFIMQKLSGRGMAFLEIDGSAVEYDLAPGQRMMVDTGNLAMVDAGCSIPWSPARGASYCRPCPSATLPAPSPPCCPIRTER